MVIKRLIFDLDNTLIDWEDSYYNFAIKNVCNDFNLDNYSEIFAIIIKLLEKYEDCFENFSIDNMLNLLNKLSAEYSNIHFTKDFVEKLIYYFSLCVPQKADSSVIETLEYLYKKYDLVVLTNWFENPQINRLKKIDILKFFSHVYGTETIRNKPNKQAFKTAVGNYSFNECVMIGDNFNTDIKGALNCNINPIFYNRKNICLPKEFSSKKIQCIKHFSDLMKIL